MYAKCIRSLVFISSIAFVTHYLYKLQQQRKKKMVKTRKEVHEVLMFSTDDTISGKKNKILCESMVKLLEYLNSAQNTVDICMYLLTNKEIYHTLLKLVYKGVKIRFITDADMAFSSGSYVQKLENKGIPVRWRKSTNIMHHKFCLIDAQVEDQSVTPLLIAGSLNWTKQALFGNWEDVIVTSQERLINQYSEEFEKLWIFLKPIVNS